MTFVASMAWSLPTWFVFAASVVLYRRLGSSQSLVILLGAAIVAGGSVVGTLASALRSTGALPLESFLPLAIAGSVGGAYGRVLLGMGILMLALSGSASPGVQSRPMPANRYLSLFCIGSTLGIASYAPDLKGAGGGYPSVFGVVLSGIALILLLCVTIPFWYRAWGSIQDGHARATPSKVVGLAFIPLFNFYWIFQMTWGFAKDFNAFLQRHGVRQAPLPQGVFLALPVLGILSLIPVAGFVVSFASSLLYVIVIVRVCDAVNALDAGDALPPGA